MFDLLQAAIDSHTLLGDTLRAHGEAKDIYFDERTATIEAYKRALQTGNVPVMHCVHERLCQLPDGTLGECRGPELLGKLSKSEQLCKEASALVASLRDELDRLCGK